MDQSGPVFEYRAVAYDRATAVEPPSYEYGPVEDHESATTRLAAMLAETTPPFDEGWVERRPVAEWRRVDD